MALSATTRRYRFRGVHSIETLAHTERCHGHEYFLEVSFYKCTLRQVDATVQDRILSALDGHDLTSVVEPATGEKIVEWVAERLHSSKLKGKILAIALQETSKNRFVSARSDARFI